MPLQKTPPTPTSIEKTDLTQSKANPNRRVSFQPSSPVEGRQTPQISAQENSQVSSTSREKQHGYRASRRSLPAHGISTREQPSILVTGVEDHSGPLLQDRSRGPRRTSMKPEHDAGLQVAVPTNRRHSSGPGTYPTYASATSRKQTSDLPMGMKIVTEIPRKDTPVHGHGGRHRISLGSSSALPSMSPFPVTKPKAAHVNGRRNQQQLLQNSATMHKNGFAGRMDARLHHGHIEKHLEVATVHAESLKLASTKSNPHLNAYRDPLSRPRSTPANGLVASPPLFRSPARTRTSTHSSQAYPFLAGPSEPAMVERRPRSVQPGEDGRARSSSAHSTATARTSVSGGTSHSQRSRSRYSNSQTSQCSKNRHQRQVVDKERLDALATLTGGNNQRNSVTADSLRLVREREKLLRWKAEREKMEFERREREKIKERVRQANLKELQRSKEMEEEVKRKKKERGCWSSIFKW